MPDFWETWVFTEINLGLKTIFLAKKGFWVPVRWPKSKLLPFFCLNIIFDTLMRLIEVIWIDLVIPLGKWLKKLLLSKKRLASKFFKSALQIVFLFFWKLQFNISTTPHALVWTCRYKLYGIVNGKVECHSRLESKLAGVRWFARLQHTMAKRLAIGVRVWKKSGAGIAAIMKGSSFFYQIKICNLR
jgi:hypothetical protein